MTAEERETTPRDEAPTLRGRLIKSIQDDDVLGLAAEIAYRFLFAVFPFGLFVAALGAFIATWLHVENPAQLLVDSLGDNLPPSIAGALQPELERLLSASRADLLSVGALAALWAATGGTNALVKGIHRAYGLSEERPFLLRYAISIGLTLLAAAGVIASFVTIVGGAAVTDQVSQRLGLGEQASAVVGVLRWPGVFIALTAAVSVLYRYAPSVVVPWRWVIAGAALFTTGWLIATGALGFYIGNVADYGATYGSLGAVVVLMLWFYVSAVMLLVGAEVTAALAHERTPGEIRRRGEERALAAAVDDVTEPVRERVRSVVDKS